VAAYRELPDHQAGGRGRTGTLIAVMEAKLLAVSEMRRIPTAKYCPKQCVRALSYDVIVDARKNFFGQVNISR
jgi:hypothetical protein